MTIFWFFSKPCSLWLTSSVSFQVKHIYWKSRALLEFLIFKLLRAAEYSSQSKFGEKRNGTFWFSLTFENCRREIMCPSENHTSGKEILYGLFRVLSTENSKTKEIASPIRQKSDRLRKVDRKKTDRLVTTTPRKILIRLAIDLKC